MNTVALNLTQPPLVGAPFVRRRDARFAAGALALGMHVAFVLLLVFGVSWQTQRPEPVMVEMWTPAPETPAPRPVKPRAPAKVASTPVPKPVPKEPPPPEAPDIALEKKKAEHTQLKKLKALQLAEEKTRIEAARAEAEAEAAKRLRETQLTEQKKHAQLRRLEDEDVARRLADELTANAARAKSAEAKAGASKRQAEVARAVGQYRDMISATVRGNTRLPDNLKGNPEVRCLVKLLPTGEVLGVRVTQSSGNPAYDDAVARAIEKSSPLPLPSDRDARAAFVPELSFVHRPKE